MTALLGGAFNPPHLGHVALAQEAARRFGEEVVVVLATDPAHKHVDVPAATRLRLVEAAFPANRVETDAAPRTVDSLRSGRWHDPLLVIGADQFASFCDWKEPDAVLELARLAVAARPGFPDARLADVRAKLRRPERVEFFELEPIPVSSAEIRERVARGEPIADLVPEGVGGLIRAEGLYRRRARLD